MNTKKQAAIFIALMLSMVCIQFDSFAVALSLQNLTNEWPNDSYMTQWVVSVYLLGVGLSMLPAGIASDKFGCRTTMKVGVLLFTVTTFFCMVAPHLWCLVIIRFFQGVSAGILVPAGIAYLTNYDKNFKRNISLVMGVGYLAMAISPVIGATIMNAYTWRAIFGFCIPLMIVATYYVFMAPQPAERKCICSTHTSGLKTKLSNLSLNFCGMTALGALSNILLLTLIVSFPRIHQDVFSLTLETTANAFTVVALSVMSGSFMAARLNQFNGVALSALLFSLLSLCYFCLSGYPDSHLFTFIYSMIAFILGITNVITLTNSQIDIPHDIAGFSVGLFKTVMTTAGAIGMAWLASIIDNPSATQDDIKQLHEILFALSMAPLLAFFLKQTLLSSHLRNH